MSEPAVKRVKQSAQPEDSEASEEVDSVAAKPIWPEEWVCSAVDAIRFKLVRRPEDVESDSCVFKPVFTHQLFEDEKICGYKGLVIDIYKAADTLDTYFNFTYSDKHPNADDIYTLVTSRFQHPFTQNLSEFVANLGQPFHPVGHKRSEYQLPRALVPKREPNLSSVVYEIYWATFDDPKVVEYHAKMQFYLLFFIDASSYINSDDRIWEMLMVFERRNFEGGETQYNFVGYVTLYKFFAYPDSTRMRVSQIFITPPHQRKGHGQRILQEVYGIVEERKYLEVTVEDPAPAFQALRDLTDMQLCVKHGFFQPEGKAARFVRCPHLENWDKDFATQVHKTLRITVDQVRRCYEAFKLQATNKNDKEQYQAYRLEVKKRLFVKHQEEISGMTEEERKEALQETYLELEKQYETALARLAQPVV